MADSPLGTGADERSLGHMQVICTLPDRASALELSDALERAGVPALVQSDHDGLPNIPVVGAGEAGVWLAVPSAMQAAAAEVLRAVGAEGVARPLLSDALAFGGGADLDAASEPQEDPIIADSGPIEGRVVLAVLAVAFGTVGQQLLARALGEAGVWATLAGSSQHTDELWRLVTAGFVHFSIPHYFGNAVFAVLFGAILFGTHRVGAVVATWLAASMIGIGAEVAASDAALVAGASAGNYGLVGLWVRGQLQRAKLSRLPRREVLRTLGIVLLLIPGALTPITSSGAKVAVVAHMIGFVTGFLLGAYFRRRLGETTLGAVEHRARLGLYVATALVVLAFGLAVPHLEALAL